VKLLDAYCSHRAFRVRVRPGPRVEVTFDPAQWASDGAVAELTLVADSPNEPRRGLPITVE
jgi:hypothetical protein